MPTAAAANEVWQLRLEGRYEGQQVINVLHFSNPVADADVETHLLAVVLSCFITNMLPVLVGSYTFERMVSKRVSPTVGLDIVTVDTNQTQAGGNVQGLPSYAAAVISIHTTRPGRSGRGRIFMSAIPEQETTNSQLQPQSAYWQGLLAFCACIVTNFHAKDPFGVGDWLFGVMSRKIGGAKPPFSGAGFAGIGPSSTPGALVPVAQLGTQRSRKVGHGS